MGRGEKVKHLTGKIKVALIVMLVTLGLFIGFSKAGIFFSENGGDVITVSTTKKIFDPNNFVASMSSVATTTTTTKETTSVTTVTTTTTKITTTTTKTTSEALTFEGKSVAQVGEILNKTLGGVMSGKGETYARLSIEKGMDPYLITAISIHETGNGTSKLARNNYNLGGIKCSSGYYCSYASVEDGISSYINLIYKNYFSKGLVTVEQMASKYAQSSAWPNTVNKWYNIIKNK